MAEATVAPAIPDLDIVQTREQAITRMAIPVRITGVPSGEPIQSSRSRQDDSADCRVAGKPSLNADRHLSQIRKENGPAKRLVDLTVAPDPLEGTSLLPIAGVRVAAE